MSFTFKAVCPDVFSVLDHHGADEDDPEQSGQCEGPVEELRQILYQTVESYLVISKSVLNVLNYWIRIKIVFSSCFSNHCLNNKVEEVHCEEEAEESVRG